MTAIHRVIPLRAVPYYYQCRRCDSPLTANTPEAADMKRRVGYCSGHCMKLDCDERKLLAEQSDVPAITEKKKSGRIPRIDADTRNRMKALGIDWKRVRED